MERQVLVDYIPFQVTPQQINESMAMNNGRVVVEGVLQRSGAKNQNGRIYPKDILAREVANYKKVQIAEKRALGELDHPESSVVNLNNVSHNVLDCWWNGDDVIDIIIKQYQTARHISRSALIFFLGQVPSNEFLDECASVYYNSEYNFQSLLKQIFCSSMFYSPNYLNNKVKTPVELLVGLSRKTGMRCIGVKTTNFFLQLCGQRLFSPPSVAGWPVGNEWLLGQNLVNRLFLPDVVLKIANKCFH